VFNSGILATGPKPGAMFTYAPASQDVLDRVSALQRACEAHGVPLAPSALQFPLRSPVVSSVLLGVSNPGNL
jgi:D-threo-aldose 1-dehydrogenase